MPQTVSIKATRDNLADIVNQVAIAGDSFIITKFGKPKAMIVPVDEEDKTELASALEEGFGMWADREDMKDSAKWVRDLRKKMSTRHV